MGASSAVSISPERPRHQQSFRQSLQKDAAIREFKTALPAPVLQAKYGSKSDTPKLAMLAANVGRASNKAAETTINLCYGAIDVGVPLEVVLRVPEKLASLIRARAARPEARLSRRELHRIETAIEGRLNNLQIPILTGEASTAEMEEARRTIAEMQKVLSDMDTELEQAINEKILNTPRDDRPNGGIQ